MWMYPYVWKGMWKNVQSIFHIPFLNVYRLWKIPTTLWLVPLRNEISLLRFAAVEMTMKWSKHLCQTVSCKPNDCPTLYLPVLMSCFCPSRQTGIYQLWCHYRRLPRFFAGAQNDPSGGKMLCCKIGHSPLAYCRKISRLRFTGSTKMWFIPALPIARNDGGRNGDTKAGPVTSCAPFRVEKELDS